MPSTHLSRLQLQQLHQKEQLQQQQQQQLQLQPQLQLQQQQLQGPPAEPPEPSNPGGDDPPEPSNPSGDDPSQPLNEGGIKALQAERDRANELDKKYRALERQFKQFEGIDPARYKEAIDALNKQAEYEQQQAQWRADTEAEIKSKYEPQLQHQQQLVATAQKELADYKRDVLLERAFLKAEGFPDAFKYASVDLASRVRLTDKGALEVLDANGEPAYVADSGKSRPMKTVELIEELIKTDIAFARHFKGNDRPGLSLRGDGSYNPDDPRFANLSPAEKLNMQRTGKRR